MHAFLGSHDALLKHKPFDEREMSLSRIRAYAIEDEKDVIALWMACGLVVPQNNPKRDIERKVKVNPDWFLVGELNGEIVASCMVGYDGHRGWINYLAVRPDCQRQGHARQIMEEAEKLLREAASAITQPIPLGPRECGMGSAASVRAGGTVARAKPPLSTDSTPSKA